MGIFHPFRSRMPHGGHANHDRSRGSLLSSRPTMSQAERRDCSVHEPDVVGLNQSIIDPGSSRNVRTRFTPDDARRFYDRFGSKQDTQGFYENPALDDLVKHADFEHAHSVLEFGCGTASFARRLFEEILPSDARYFGLDISGTMIGLATKRLDRWRDRAEARQTPGTPALSVSDASFDRFLATYVFDLLDPDFTLGLIAEAHRILVPGGLFCTVNLTHGLGAFPRFVSRLWT
jgi:ubiquinone/menaquinone biosynthesis C-methylase UbiE